MKKFIISLMVLTVLLGSAGTYYARAQEATTEPPPETQQAPSKPQKTEDSGEEDTTRYYYEEPIFTKFSQLYWALSKLDPENDLHVDNYLRINECEIYMEYAHNEFEWKSVREASRDYLVKNRKNFPLRFTYMQQILLKDYSFERGGFEVHDDYKIFNTRRFEIAAEDTDMVCGSRYELEGYPKIMHVELSRPFGLEFVKADPEIAQEFVRMKSEIYESYDTNRQDKDMLYSMRDAYITMNVKIYAYKGQEISPQGKEVASVLGVLESYEIYADREKKFLLYAENYRRRKRASKMEEELIKDYQSLKQGKQASDRPDVGLLSD